MQDDRQLHLVQQGEERSAALRRLPPILELARRRLLVQAAQPFAESNANNQAALLAKRSSLADA